MENRVKILIADGNEEFCDHIKRRLEQVPSYEIVGTAADGQRALELMRVTKPDILVLDLMLSKLDGIAVLKRAREMDKAPAALVLTGFMTEYVANMAASLGVQYFMTKPCELDAVAERIHEMTAIDSQLRQNAQRRQHRRHGIRLLQQGQQLGDVCDGLLPGQKLRAAHDAVQVRTLLRCHLVAGHPKHLLHAFHLLLPRVLFLNYISSSGRMISEQRGAHFCAPHFRYV